MRPNIRASALRVATTAGCVLAMALASGCTEDEQPEAVAPSPAASVRSPAPPPERDAPLELRIVRVAGELGSKDRLALRAALRSPLERYFQEAFVGGDYPRTDFDDALSSSFSPGAERKARGDLDLLTNAAVGERTRSVTALVQRVGLDVLAPTGRPVGATAQVRLVLSADRLRHGSTRITITGRLLLTPAGSNRWRIFGYDLARSAVPDRGPV